MIEPLRQAFRLLWAHKLRASLTLFGLVWGTAAVIFDGGRHEGEQNRICAGRRAKEMKAKTRKARHEPGLPTQLANPSQEHAARRDTLPSAG